MATRRKSTYARGKEGLAEVRALKSALKLLMHDGAIYEIGYDDVECPYATGDNIYAKMNSAGTKLYELRPTNDTFIAKFAGFPHKTDQLPKPFTLPAKDMSGWTRPARDVFYALFSVEAGKLKGLQARGMYPYDFDREPSGAMFWNGAGDWGINGEKFLTLCGFDWDVDTIPYDEELLANLAELLLSKERLLQIEVSEKGYVQNIGKLPEGFKVK